MKKSWRYIVTLTVICIKYCQSYKDNVKEYSTHKSCGDFPSISHGTVHYTDMYAKVECQDNYQLKGNDKFKCDYHTGVWSPQNIPQCLKKNDTCSLPKLNHGMISLSSPLTGVLYCYNKYVIQQGSEFRSSSIYCLENKWYYLASPLRMVVDCVADTKCSSPPPVSHADVVYEYPYKNQYEDGSKVYYKCQSYYNFLHSDQNYYTCSNGMWIGRSPECVSSPYRRKCINVPSVDHASWRLYEPSQFYTSSYIPDFEVDTKVQFACENGYRMIGESVVQCLADGSWTASPKCLDMTGTRFCHMPIIPNGNCQCDSTFGCSTLTTGSKVVCSCNQGYQLEGQEILACQRGQWGTYPTCISTQSTDISVDDQSSSSTHMNTLAIVITTACSVLGVLLMVMVIVVLRRRKPHHHRLYDQGHIPTPYTRVHPLDEHDRVALIGYETARLPSYEEAISNTPSTRAGNVRSVASDYRPLPTVPPSLSSASQTDAHNRHSVVTSTHDGEVFGSIDTVNFSVSDASTAGTVDTMDSRISQPSRGSGTAAAGSLESSRENLSSEDAPLLENSEVTIAPDNQVDVKEDETKET